MKSSVDKGQLWFGYTICFIGVLLAGYGVYLFSSEPDLTRKAIIMWVSLPIYCLSGMLIFSIGWMFKKDAQKGARD